MHLVDDKSKKLKDYSKLLKDLSEQTEGGQDILTFVTASLS